MRKSVFISLSHMNTVGSGRKEKTFVAIFLPFFGGEFLAFLLRSIYARIKNAHTKTGGWDCTVCLTGEATASCCIFNVSMHGSMSRLHTAINSAFVGMQNICTGATGTVSSDFSVHTFVNETFLEIKKKKNSQIFLKKLSGYFSLTNNTV